MSGFTEIANRMGTDKGTQVGAAHGYSLVYEMLMAPLRDRSRVDILEIGLAIGGPEVGGAVDRSVARSPSVETWVSYFANAHVAGFDISDFSHLSSERFRFIRGDSGRREDLERIRGLQRRFDVIVDDASHASYHQQLALAMLFDLLNPGGIYIIEDLGWQPAELERKLPKVPRTVEVLAGLLKNGRVVASPAIDDRAADLLSEAVSAISFFDESFLNALGDSYNRRLGLPRVERAGWRARHGVERAANPHFWLYSFRRFKEGLTGMEFINFRSTKLAILQRVVA